MQDAWRCSVATLKRKRDDDEKKPLDVTAWEVWARRGMDHVVSTDVGLWGGEEEETEDSYSVISEVKKKKKKKKRRKKRREDRDADAVLLPCRDTPEVLRIAAEARELPEKSSQRLRKLSEALPYITPPNTELALLISAELNETDVEKLERLLDVAEDKGYLIAFSNLCNTLRRVYQTGDDLESVIKTFNVNFKRFQVVRGVMEYPGYKGNPIMDNPRFFKEFEKGRVTGNDPVKCRCGVGRYKNGCCYCVLGGSGQRTVLGNMVSGGYDERIVKIVVESPNTKITDVNEVLSLAKSPNVLDALLDTPLVACRCNYRFTDPTLGNPTLKESLLKSMMKTSKSLADVKSSCGLSPMSPSSLPPPKFSLYAQDETWTPVRHRFFTSKYRRSVRSLCRAASCAKLNKKILYTLLEYLPKSPLPPIVTYLGYPSGCVEACDDALIAFEAATRTHPYHFVTPGRLVVVTEELPCAMSYPNPYTGEVFEFEVIASGRTVVPLPPVWIM